MKFEDAHGAWISWHLRRRKGERKGRLERGHGHAEILFCRVIWWILKGNFEHLHPEYEVRDLRGGRYFADFAFFRGPLKILIEIKGYIPHVQNLSRQGFRNELKRELYLQGLGYKIISIAYDDLEEQPDQILAMLRMVLSQYEPSQGPVSQPVLAEAEVLRFACQLHRPIRPKDVSDHLNCNYRTSMKALSALTDKGWLLPKKVGDRTCQYEVSPRVIEYWK